VGVSAIVYLLKVVLKVVNGGKTMPCRRTQVKPAAPTGL